MTSLQLLKNISNIDSQWLVDMETQKAPAPKPRYSLLVAVICLLALLLAGCGSPAQNTAAEPQHATRGNGNGNGTTPP